MKLLLDQNLSRRILERIEDLFSGSDHVANRALDRVPDEEVSNFAVQEGFTIVSKDSDFHQMSLVRGFPPKVVFLKIGNCTTDLVVSLICKHEADFREFTVDESASLLIVEL